MPLIGAVADDLTGATTTGVLLARSKARTAVFFNEEAAENTNQINCLDAILVSSNSRALPKLEAYEKVKSATKALLRMGVRYFSKRIDTTLRGGVGIEIDAMLDQLGQDAVAVVVPAMPQSNRILVGGYSIIDGTALIRTSVVQDVRTPVHENYIPKLIQAQTKRKVGLIELSTVLQGADAIEAAMKKEREEGDQVIIVDGITQEDVEEIAKACVHLQWNIVAVDPGAFTAKLAYCRGMIEKEEANIPKESVEEAGKTVLIAAGSATSVTKRQIEVLCEDKRHVQISVDPLCLIEGGEKAYEEVQRAAELAIQYMNGPVQPRAIVLETALHGDILDLDEEDRKHEYAGGMSANRINSSLGMIIARILDSVGKDRVAGLYTTGGDTMVNVCYQLGVECIEMIDYVIAQTDVGRLVGNYEGLPVIGKGGLTGNDHIAVDIVNRLFKEAARK